MCKSALAQFSHKLKKEKYNEEMAFLALWIHA